jgi:hypothetical protein
MLIGAIDSTEVGTPAYTGTGNKKRHVFGPFGLWRLHRLATGKCQCCGDTYRNRFQCAVHAGLLFSYSGDRS